MKHFLVLSLLVTCPALGACRGDGTNTYSSARLTGVAGTRTLAVRPIHNNGFRRDLELHLTHALIEALRDRSAWRIADPASADLVIEGNMTAAEDAIGIDENRDPIQKQLRGTLQLVLRERSSGRVVRQATVADLEVYRFNHVGEGLDTSARDEWTRRVAVRAVQALESPW